MAKEIQRIANISVGRMGFSKPDLQELVIGDKKKDHVLFHVVGQAVSAEPKTSDKYENNDYIQFKGSFEAINAKTGEAIRSGKLILPSIIENEIASVIAAGGIAQIALTITVKYAEKLATSYTFGCLTYGETENDPMEALKQLIPSLAKALPPPTAKTETKKK